MARDGYEVLAERDAGGGYLDDRGPRSDLTETRYEPSLAGRYSDKEC